MNVSVVIPTRGDQDLTKIIDSLAQFDEVLIWDNSKREDLSVYGRYAMIEEARNDVILTQDDDCVLAPEAFAKLLAVYQPGHVVCNLPQKFRDTGNYDDSALVGFGAIFDRDLPAKAFERFAAEKFPDFGPSGGHHWSPERIARTKPSFLTHDFARECDTVFTTLTPRVLVDVSYTDMPWASAPNRLWKQPEHVGKRKEMRDLARKVRDA